MKVLQLCHKPPKPSIDGGCIAMNNISEGLMKNKCKLKIITIGTQKHPIKFDELHENYLDRTKIEGVFVDTKLNLVDAFSPKALCMNSLSSIIQRCISSNSIST